jgi:predicted amidohydrolase YtcJ
MGASRQLASLKGSDMQSGYCCLKSFAQDRSWIRAVCGLMIATWFSILLSIRAKGDEPADAIFVNGRIVTVNERSEIVQAFAVRGERIIAVGSDSEVRKLAGPSTILRDLEGRMVLPGLIDSHVHAPDAAVYEWDHEIPDMRTVEEVLEYIRGRAEALEEGKWIIVSQVFVTRLSDPRFPTRYELDRVAPKHPVFFRTGPDAALNSLALKLCGIDKNYKLTDGEPGYLERDPQTQEPNGILRSCSRIVKAEDPRSKPSFEQRSEQLEKLLRDYNSVGITSICDRATGDDGIKLYESILSRNALTCRVFLSYSVNAQASMEDIERSIFKAATHPRHAYSNFLWLRGVKIFLDGGMLTGSAYMREPWGVSEIYSITDPQYRGLLYVEASKLYQMAKLALKNDLQFTAHSVGDGAILSLIDAYERIAKDDFPVNDKRPCITHCNFMSAEAIERMSRLGIVADLQPAWLVLDGKTLLKQFGEERTKYFQPYRSLFDNRVVIGGGSDHMQKIGSLRSVNPYNPFLGMWATVVRMPRGMDKSFHPEQIISRYEAIRLYTINNAYLTFEEKEKGSIETGKLADFIIVDRDLLSCPAQDIADTQVLETYVGGKRVYELKKE